MPAQGPEVDAGGALGRSAAVDHLEGLKWGDQHLLLLREEGVAPDRDTKAGPDAKEGFLAEMLGCGVLQGRRGKAPQPDGDPRPCWLEAQALHPSEHLAALGGTLGPAQQLQGLGQQEMERLEGEVLEVVDAGAARLAQGRIELLVQGGVGRVGQEGHPVLITEAGGWWGHRGVAEAPLWPPGFALLPLAAGQNPAVSVYFVGLELRAVEIWESSCHGCCTASILVIEGGWGHVQGPFLREESSSCDGVALKCFREDYGHKQQRHRSRSLHVGCDLG